MLHTNIFVKKVKFEFLQLSLKKDGCKPVPEDFEYNSGTNTWFLTLDEMKE
jgi:hypothetical protein